MRSCMAVREEIASTLSKGGDEKSGGLDVGDCIGAGVTIGEQGASFAGGEACRGQGKQKVPVDVLAVGSCFN